jgi:class 3 adenylate cyclase/predicted ATPase
MTFEKILDQAVAMLQRRGRMTYRTLKLQFQMDDETLETLKEEILYSQPQVVDDEGKGLIWTGETAGTPVSASPPPQTIQPPDERLAAESRSPEAERRQLTVMFVDLVGSTNLSGELDPEDYREVVRQYQQVCSEVIQRYDGHVAQLLGDGLLVYFGYPQAHEDDAQRAVRAGLGIVEAIRSLNTGLEQEKGIKLAVRLGIHTGLVVVGEMGGSGRQEQLAMGETPNVAARIQSIALPDTVVISADTYRLVQGYFSCEPLGEHGLRGGAQPITVYHVLRESGVQSRLDVASTRGLTPLVGREQEVGLLIERWEQAKDGQGQIILLSGEAGIGKSRLVQVLKDHVASEPHTQWECRSSPYYQNSALHPIIDLIQRTLRWQQDDTPEEKLAKLEGQLSQYCLPLEETVSLFAPLLSLSVPEERYPPLGLSPQRQRQKTLESIGSILLELAERQPILLILEDLHWTDPTTLEFLALLIDHIPTASISILLTCRPTFQPSWSHRTNLTEITVHRLSNMQAEQMVEKVTESRSLPPAVLQQLIEKSDGVPLYLEEMTKAILESGHLKEVNGRYELVGSLASLAIPATLQDSLMARLDQLGTAKRIAQLGATLGRTFTYDLLQAVSSLGEFVVWRSLAELVEAKLLYQRGALPHATFTFKHALIQDTAYQSLLRSTRQQYHCQIAQVLEERFPETAQRQPELLAHHYTEAGHTDQAVGYWQLASQQAVQRSANVEAVAYLQKGLELLKTLPDTTERAQQELHVRLTLGRLLMSVKGYAAPEVRHTYARARALCHQVGDTPELISVLYGIYGFYATRAEYMTARELGEECLRLAQRQHDPGLRLQALLQAHGMLGIALLFLGKFVAVRTHTDQAVALYVSQQHCPHAWQDHGVIGLMFAAWALWSLGHPDQALRRSQEALTLAREYASPRRLVWALIYAAGIHLFRREPQRAHQLAEEAFALATAQEFLLLTAACMLYQGGALAMQEQYTEGLARLRQGLATYQTIEAGLGQSLWLAQLAEATGNAGQAAEGLALVAEARAWVDIHAERFWEAELHRLQGRLLLQDASPDAHQAEACFQQALALARRQQAKSLELRAATSLARLWQSQDKRQEAYELLAPVYDWFTEGFDTADLQEAKRVLGDLS